MASLYERKLSPFWWIKYKDSRGKIVRESTGLRRDDREQTRKARSLCAERTSGELAVPLSRTGEHWGWVPTWLRARYAGDEHAKTLQRYQAIWLALDTFLRAHGITQPRALQREHAFSYLDWRKDDAKMRMAGLRTVKHNTAVLELKCLSTIMREAVARNLAPANPCAQLGIKRVKVRQKPEIAPAEIAIIEEALKAEQDDALSRSWLIAMLHGRRLSETCVPLAEVDVDAKTISFRNKGGELRTKLLHPELIPLFRKLKKEGATHAFTMPENFSKKWKYFFRRIGLPHLSFHSTRVTVVNKLRDAGVDVRDAMDFVDHSSVIVHQSYQRAKLERQRSAVNALASRKGGTKAQAGSGAAEGARPVSAVSRRRKPSR